MNIKRAISTYKSNIEAALEGRKRFSLIECNHGCRCVVGIKFDDVALEYGELRCVRNGYRFKTPINLGNSLEWLYYPLIKANGELQKAWDREDRLSETLDT